MAHTYKPEYMMTLSAEEMKFIRDLLRNVGGDPNNSRRRYADSILKSIVTQPEFDTWRTKHDFKSSAYGFYFTTPNGEI